MMRYCGQVNLWNRDQWFHFYRWQNWLSWRWRNTPYLLTLTVLGFTLFFE